MVNNNNYPVEIPKTYTVSYYNPETDQNLTAEEWNKLNSSANPNETRIVNQGEVYRSWKTDAVEPSYGPTIFSYSGIERSKEARKEETERRSREAEKWEKEKQKMGSAYTASTTAIIGVSTALLGPVGTILVGTSVVLAGATLDAYPIKDFGTEMISEGAVGGVTNGIAKIFKK